MCNNYHIAPLQIMELSESYTPEISEFKVRIVRSESIKMKWDVGVRKNHQRQLFEDFVHRFRKVM